MKGVSGNARETALDILLRWEKGEETLSLCTERMLRERTFADVRDAALARQITFGTVEYLLLLDEHINRHAATKTDKMEPLIRWVLRTAAYQILFLDRVPDRAAVNEAVTITAKRGRTRLKGFVNAVLRALAREKEGDEITDISVRYSVPQWIIDLWTKAYGEAVTQELLRASHMPRPLTIRFDERIDISERERYTCLWRNEGIRVEADKRLDYAFHLTGVKDLPALPGFKEGACYVQDITSMMVAEEAGAGNGDTIIDTCAAPGGKILHLYAKLNGEGTFHARDISAEKCARIRENAERLHAEHLHITRHDATITDDKLRGKADIVLTDVPCSGLGVIGRKPDLKYRVQPGDIEKLVKLQREIVTASVPLLKEHGRLLYSTCTIGTAENDEQANWITEHLPLRLMKQQTFLPDSTGTDGFFIAIFGKTVHA